ncbi:MAG: cytochrome c oxidase subunit II [Flavobacteriaceae bacterium]
MTSLLVVIVLILLGVAVWQISKIYTLTQIGAGAKIDDSQVANDRDNKVNGYLMFGFLVFIYIFTIYGLFKWGGLVLISNSAAEHGKDIDNLMIISFVMIFVVQFITQALLHYFAFKYRGVEGRKALYVADNNRLEAIWTIVPVIALSVLILYGLYTWNNVMFVDPEEEDVLYVELYAKQFSWEARYAGEDQTLGKANVRLIEGVNTIGVDMSDPNAKDDIVTSELHLPIGKRVVFKIRSQDVLHSAYMPHFRAQMNCVPGMVTQFSFIPSITTAEFRQLPETVDKVAHINELRRQKSIELTAKGEDALDPYEFDYLLLCNKICGSSHYNMQMKIVVETQEEFDEWIASQQTLYSKVFPPKEETETQQPEEAQKVATDSIQVAIR